MPVPSYRVPVRVARGTLAALTAGLSDLQEGELCYTTDGNALYVIEGGVLTATAADLTGIEIINDTTPQLGGDLDTNSFQIISTAAGNIQIAPDTTGVLEVRGNTGNDAAIQLNCETNGHGVKIQSPPHSAAATYTLVLPDDTGTTGQALTTDGAGVLSWATPSTVGSIDDLTDVDTTTSAPTTGQGLVWDGAQWAPGDVSDVDLATSSIDELSDVDTSSVAPTDGQALVWSTADSEWVPGDVAVDLGATSINALSDVDTTTASPTNDQVLAWNGTNWVPADAASGGGGSSAARLTETQTASSGIATFSGIGHSGTLVDVTSSLDAWIVLYDSAASRTADSSRGYATDPASGSGVLAEFYVTATGTVLATPGTTYFNNDTSVTEAIYAAVRDQAGANVDSAVTITAYGNQATTSATTRALLGIGEYVDDAAAGTGGVTSGAMYYNTTSSDYRLKS